MQKPDVEHVLRVDNISKSYSSNKVLHGVSLSVRPGEVHAIMGENGAGKSTLIKCISGVVSPDSGAIFVDGRPIHLGSVASAEDAGIAAIHQESTAFAHLSSVENIFVGHELTRLGLLDRNAMRTKTRQLLDDLGESFNVDVPVSELSLAQRQMVGVARAVVRKSRLLIMDEPTASLSSRESEALFKLISMLQKSGVAILYISHRLEEIFRLSDFVSVLRDGHVVGTKPTDQLSRDELIRMMVGRDLIAQEAQTYSKGDREFVLQVSGLSRDTTFQGIDIEIAAGEIVGMAGLVGAGRSEVASAIFGVDGYDSGTVSVGGHRVRQGSVRRAIEAGIALVPEDRQHQGLVLDQSVGMNLLLSQIASRPLWSVRNRKQEAGRVSDLVSELAVKTAGTGVPAKTLSGGNQQKLVVGKWIAMSPRVLILDEPTRGVDVGAKGEIYRKIRELAKSGMATLVISSDLPEVLTLCDRIYVMRQGKISGILNRDDATEQKILALALPESVEVAI